MMIIPREAQTQKDLKAGNEEEAPIPKAMKFVTDVMVMATPACAMVAPILSSTDLDFSFSEESPMTINHNLVVKAKPKTDNDLHETNLNLPYYGD